MRIFGLVLIVLLFSACSTVHPPVTEYRLNLNMPKNIQTQSGCSDKSLKVAQAFSSTSLMTLNMNYVEGSMKQFAYSQAQWSVSPNDAITSEIIEMLRETKLFKSVQVSKSRSKSDMILEINIEDFTQYFSNDFDNSYGNAVVTLTLIDSKSSKVIATKTFNSKVDAKTLDAEGGVHSLSSALSDILKQSSVWFNEVCK
jgi:cholesterol transport system auxiliary component